MVMEKTDSIEDVVAALGYLCLGTRLRRVAERLQAATQEILADSGVQVGYLPFLAAIDRLGALTVGDMARAMGVSQPAATKALGQLSKFGFVRQTVAPDDGRRKLAELTPKGRALVDRSKVGGWLQVEAAVSDLCAGLEGSVLTQLTEIERRLAERPLKERS